MTLLDTNAIIWFFTLNGRLGRRAYEMITTARRRGEAAFSAMSIWEIGMLLQKGRISRNRTVTQWHERLLAEGFHEIPVTGVIAARAGDLPDMHGDPADRIVVATALEGHLLVTSDAPILNWPHRLDRFPATR
ncbi:MAG: type II toxin-antitoxin system VapC family toxin [Chloroflexota bacterium]|nr:type II toxin-antitoxin system VapC family toxin [Chloroflexota bacterium]MDE2959189.1 type II toxin-antitoxin system VapC family toxin [Chloroflexota bacterium]